MTILVFEQNLPYAGFGELTKTSFIIENDALDAHEFLGYFIRFALSAGYQIESIKDAIIQLAQEYEAGELVTLR